MHGDPTNHGPRSRPPLRRYGPPAAATLGAGAVMMIGGDLFHTHGWSMAGPAMMPAGFLISGAFALENRSRPTAGSRDTPMSRQRFRRLVLLVAGVPMSASGVPPLAAMAITAFTLLAGLAMAVAGYAVAAWNPIAAPPLILLSGLIILAAFYIGVRSQSPRDEAPVGLD